MTTKTPAQLWAEHGVEEPLVAVVEPEATTPDPVVVVDCKSCGAEIDVAADPDTWPLQCAGCVTEGVALPAGYEDLIGGEHDHGT